MSKEEGPLFSNDDFEKLQTKGMTEAPNIMQNKSPDTQKLAFYLFELLQKVANHEEEKRKKNEKANIMNVEKLATVIAPNLFPE